MQVIVKIHEAAMAEYEAWMARHSQPPTGSNELAALLYDELVAELIRKQGRPAGAERVEMGDLSHYRWRFSTDTWVRFVIHETPPRWFRAAGRKVVVTSISDSADG